MRRTSCFLLLFALVVVGCAGSSAASGGDSYQVIDMSEIENASIYNDALDVVTTLRPLWLEDNAPVVYVDGDPLPAGVRQLNTFQPEEIARFRYYSDFDQKPEFVTETNRTAIVVTTR